MKLNHLASKDDNNHRGSVMLGKWNDRLSCLPYNMQRMDGKFNCWYFAGYTVHLTPVQKG